MTKKNEEGLAHGFLVAGFATVLHTGPQTLRHPAFLPRSSTRAPGRPGPTGCLRWERLLTSQIHLVDLVPDDRPEVFDWRQVWDVARSYTLRLKVREFVLAPPLGLGGDVSYGLVLLKNYLDMSGRILTAALLEACSPFDALSPTLPSHSALLYVEVRRDSFAAGNDTDVGNTQPAPRGHQFRDTLYKSYSSDCMHS